MPFAPESVFVTQPLLLDIRQRRYIAGVRFAVETVELSKSRLWRALERFEDSYDDPKARPATAELFADAWTIVDNARRLQRLLWKMPGATNLDMVQDFVKRWPELKAIRDAVQHIDEDFKDDKLGGNYVYGELYWIDSRLRVSQNKIYAHCLSAGPQANATLTSSTFPSSIPIDTGDGIHFVSLRAFGVTLDVSRLLGDVDATIARLQVSLTSAIDQTITEQKLLHPERAEKLAIKVRTDASMRLKLSVRDPAEGG